MRLTRSRLYNIRELQKFFAQSDIDVISNFPLSGHSPQREEGYGLNSNPFYELSYYANGQNLLVGLLKKTRTDDREILKRLRTF